MSDRQGGERPPFSGAYGRDPTTDFKDPRPAMQVERRDDDHWHFALGPVERWAIVAGAAALFSLVAWVGNGFSKRQDQTQAQLVQIAQQQAVTNAQITTLSAQLADVPGLTQQMAALTVRVSDNERRIGNLEQVRGHLK